MTAVTVLFFLKRYQPAMESAIQQTCLECALRPDRFFCDLPTNVLAALDNVKSTIVCPRNTVLFREGQSARGVFVLCNGKARLSVCSESGKRLTLHVAVPGEVLGLSAVLSGSNYEVTAELLEGGQVAMVKRKELLNFLREHREACLHMVGLLSQDLHVAYDRVRSVGLGKGRRQRSVAV